MPTQLRGHFLVFACLLLSASACSTTQGSSSPADDAGPIGPTSKDGGVDAGEPPDAGPTDGGEPDAGPHGPPCGDILCDVEEVCFEGACCLPNCDSKECGSDGCGGSCGDCQPHFTCGTDFQCSCQPEDDATLCADHHKVCGSLTATTRCGEEVTVECDACVPPLTCDTVAGICDCDAPSVQQFCQVLGKECGMVTGQDDCGTTRTEDCGGCERGKLCNANHVCETCVAKTDAQLCEDAGNKDCGSITVVDNCNESRTVSCGTCATGSVCNASTNRCEVCPPESDAAFCARVGKTCGTVAGTDSCGLAKTASCGTCTGTDFCDGTNHCQACVPETDAQFCTRQLKQCGAFSGTDNCGVARSVTSCGGCGASETCIGNQCQLCVPETDAQLCTNGGKNCGSPTFTDSCGVPRTIASCGTCTSPQTCQSNSVCGTPGVPTNNDCGGAEVITLNPTTGTAIIQGDTTLATDSGTTVNCLGTGYDVVYSLTIGSPKNVDISLTTTATGYSVVSIRSACSDKNTEITCNDVNTDPNAIGAHGLAAGTYFIWVDGYGGAQGPFTLTVTATDPPPPPTNDTCATPEVLNLVNGVATATGNNVAAINDTTGTCGTMNSGDMVYSFTLARDSAVIARVTRDSTTPAFVPAVFIRSACSSTAATDEKACGVAPSGSPSATAVASLLTAGSYYVFVDGTGGTYGAFTLEVSTPNPVPNDNCTSPTVLTIDSVTGIATASGDTILATNDGDGSCKTSSGQDLVYSFTLAQPQYINIRVTPTAGSAFKPAVYVRSDCTQTSTQKGCAYTSAASTPVALAVPQLAAGTYYLFVDSYTSAYAGPFDLQVTASSVPPPPPNDTCAGATALTFNASGVATAMGDTMTATDDYQGYCSVGSTLLTGLDVVYSFTLTSPATVTAKVTRDAANTVYKPAVSIRTSCQDPVGSEVACARDSSGVSTASATLQAGTYYVFVDGVTSTTNGSGWGPFTLEVSQAAAVASDNCGDVQAINLDPITGIGVVSGDLRNAAKNDTGSCYSTTGQDMVYSVTLNSEKTVKVTMAPSTGTTVDVRSNVYMRKNCADPATELGCAYTSTAGGTVTFTVNRVQAGTYFIWADSYSTSYNGPFTITVETSTPTSPAPSNDTCAGAQPLVLDPVSHAARITGDTTWASPDYAGRCMYSATYPLGGGDVVYQISLRQPMTLFAVVNKDPAETKTFYPAIYLRSVCDSSAPADEVACGSTAGYQTASFTQPLAAGTYFLIIDGQKGYGGKFIADVVARPTGTTPNDTCANAEALVLDSNGTAAVAGSTVGLANDGTGSCYSSSTAPDAVYTLTLPSPKDVTIDLLGGAGFYPMVHVRSNCGDSTTQIACDYKSTYGVPIHLVLPHQAAGTYAIYVDGYSTYSGTFTLLVNAVDPPPPPFYDTCARPQAIALPASGAAALRITDNTMNAANDYTGACGSSTNPLDGADLVYTFSVSANTQVTAKVTPKLSTYKAAVYVRSTCATVSDDICKLSTSAGSANPATVTASLPPGTYYLIVDGVGGTYGDFDLDVSQDTSKYIAGDHCLNAVNLATVFQPGPNGSQVATLTGNTLNAFSDGEGGCNSSTGAGDYVYTFTLANDSVIDVTVGPDTSGGASSYTSEFYLRSSCADKSAQLMCQYTSSTNTPKSGKLIHVQPGTYYLWIDAYSSSTSYNGPFTATISVMDTPPAPLNDTCRGAKPLAFTGATTPETVSLTNEETTYAIDDYAGSCGSSAGGDVVYTFSTSTAKSLQATVTPVSSTSWKPTLYLRTVCEVSSTTNELTCRRTTTGGGAVAINVNSLQPGVYYLVVDGTMTASADASNGKFNLDVTLADPVTTGPANDYCPNAQSITLTGGIGTTTTLANQTTVGAAHDTFGSCQTTANAPDVVYTFDLPVTAKVSVKVTPASGFAPAVYIRTACGGQNGMNQVVCAYSATAGTVVTATGNSMHPGTYWIWVDGGTTTTTAWSGTFQLDIALDTPAATPPANDTCAGAIPLTFGVPYSGDTTNGINDYEWGSSSAPGCGNPPPYANDGYGAEVVFSYTPTASGQFKVTFSTTIDAAMWINTDTCGDRRTCVGGRDGGNPEFLIVNGIAGRTYFIYGEAYSATVFGTYTVTVENP